MTDEQFEVLKAKYPKQASKYQQRLDAGEITLQEFKNLMYRVEHTKGYYEKTRDVQLARANTYNGEHREEKREYNRQYDATHKLQKQEHDRKYYLEHRDEILARCHQWFAEHKEEKQEYDRRRYAVNKIKLMAYHKQYFKDHLELNRVYRENRRARELGQEDQFTPIEWLDKQEEYGNRCIYCGTRSVDAPEGVLVPDHAIPLAKGGSGHIDNIVPSCKSCNDAKHTMTAEEFFWSIDSGHQEDVLTRRYINDHPEIIDKVLELV